MNRVGRIVIGILTVPVVIYLLPTFIADRRRLGSDWDVLGVGYLNFFFGWTVIVWVFLLGYSLCPRKLLERIKKWHLKRHPPRSADPMENVTQVEYRGRWIHPRDVPPR